MLGGDGGSSLQSLAAVAAIAAASYGTSSRDEQSTLGLGAPSFDLSTFSDNIRPSAAALVENLGIHQPGYIRGRAAQIGYLCPFSPSCVKRFRDKTDLTRHIRTHTGESPFACPHCTYRSKQKGSLKVHILKCHGGGDGKGQTSPRKYHFT